MKRTFLKISWMLICVFMISQTGRAEEALSVSHNTVKDSVLYAYVENPGEYETASCQIGREYSADVSVKEMTDPDISVSTYILIDNSLSIQEKYRDTMKQVARELVMAGKANESFTIATFDTEIHYLIENSQDPDALAGTVEQIEFQNLDTQVFNVLYSLYEKLEDGEDGSLKRIILMSDGAESKAIGYTKEELIERAKAVEYPVYVLGCTYQSNESELENMFRISRETNADYYLLDEVENAEQVAGELADSFDFVQVRAEIPESQQDGSSKGVKIVFQGAEGEKTAAFSQTMPFFSGAPAQITELQMETEDENLTEAVEGQEASQETAEQGFAEEEAGQRVSKETEGQTAAGEAPGQGASQNRPEIVVIAALAAAAICMIAGIIAAVFLFRKKKNKKAAEEVEEKAEEQTELINSADTEWLNESGAFAADAITIRLTDTKRPNVAMEYPLASSVTVGRSAEKSQFVFNYERSVSGAHCEIFRRGDKVYIRDLNSANLTYVDGKTVEEKTELTDGAIIKIGRLLLKFEIINTGKKNTSEEKRKTDTEYMFEL